MQTSANKISQSGFFGQMQTCADKIGQIGFFCQMRTCADNAVFWPNADNAVLHLVVGPLLKPNHDNLENSGHISCICKSEKLSEHAGIRTRAGRSYPILILKVQGLHHSATWIATKLSVELVDIMTILGQYHM